MSAGVDTDRPVGTATYVYGIASRPAQLHRAGVAGADVGAVEHRSLTAICSAVPAARLRARRRDVLAHQEVLQDVFAQGPVLPLRFGTVFAGDDAVIAELLAPKHDALLRLLRRLESSVELSVRAYYLEEPVLREIVRDEPQIARLRRARTTSDLALGEAVAAALSAKRAAEAAAIERALVGLARDAAIEEPRTEYELFRGAFLVDRTAVGAFDAAMNRLAQTRDGIVVFKYIGPLPPHSFVDAEAVEG